MYMYMFLMRDEKEERKKQARSNKQTRQSNTAHPRQSLFRAASGGTRTHNTLYSRQSALPAELPRQHSTSHSTPDVHVHVLLSAVACSFTYTCTLRIIQCKCIHAKQPCSYFQRKKKLSCLGWDLNRDILHSRWVIYEMSSQLAESNPKIGGNAS